MRIIVKFEKGENLRYLSHLDMQRVFHRAINRARIPIAYSQGFNPHPKTSFASALALGQTGLSEWMEIQLEEGSSMTPNELKDALNASFPAGLTAVWAGKAPEGYPSLTAAMKSARYTAYPVGDMGFNSGELSEKLSEFLSGPIIVEKKKKSKGRSVLAETDIRPTIVSMEYAPPAFYLKGRLDAAGGMNAELVLQAFAKFLGCELSFRIQRDSIDLEPELK